MRVNLGPIVESTIQFFSVLNEFHADVDDAANRLSVSHSNAVVSLSGVSIGVVTWMLRSGALLASMMANVPAWRAIDPLVVLGYFKDDIEDDETLLEIIDGQHVV